MTKVISLSDESYTELARLKKSLSFSEIIIKLIKEKRKDELMKFAGILSNEEAEKMKKEISEIRKLPSRRFK